MNSSEMDRINYSGVFEFSDVNRDNTSEKIRHLPEEKKKKEILPSIVRPTGLRQTLIQIRAIFLKNISFQKTQIAMNIFQLLSPLICIFLIWLAQYEMKILFKEDYSFQKIHGIPFFFNLPTSFFSQSTAYPVASFDCLKWFLYSDKRKSGSQNLPIEILMRPQFNEFCRRANYSVPIFNKTDNNVNDDIYKTLLYLEKYPMFLGQELEELDRLPDAGLVFTDYTKHSIDVEIQMNDLLFNEFHRDNGFSKMSFKVPDKGFNFFKELSEDYLSTNKSFKALDQGFERLKEFFSQNTSIAEEVIKVGSEKIYNNTQSAIKKMLNNRKTTFPVF